MQVTLLSCPHNLLGHVKCLLWCIIVIRANLDKHAIFAGGDHVFVRDKFYEPAFEFVPDGYSLRAVRGYENMFSPHQLATFAHWKGYFLNLEVVLCFPGKRRAHGSFTRLRRKRGRHYEKSV